MSAEVDCIEGKPVWKLRKAEGCWAVTSNRSPPYQDEVGGYHKSYMKSKYDIRSRMVAKHYRGGDKGRDALFAETPPLEAKRMLMSRAATRRKDGRSRKLMLIDVKKAHLNPVCEEDAYLELPEECHCPPGYCG
eukprot:8688191-Karenia_brevis.AAC.1